MGHGTLGSLSPRKGGRMTDSEAEDAHSAMLRPSTELTENEAAGGPHIVCPSDRTSSPVIARG